MRSEIDEEISLIELLQCELIHAIVFDCLRCGILVGGVVLVQYLFYFQFVFKNDPK